MFRKEEIDLLDVCYQTFIGRTHIFDVLSAKKWRDTGIENWVQTEFIAALFDRGFDVSTYGKRRRDCDIIVRNEQLELDVGIEIKTLTHTSYYREILINQGIKKHSKADLFLFLTRFDNDMLRALIDYLEQNDYIEEHRMLNDDWMVMIVKRG